MIFRHLEKYFGSFIRGQEYYELDLERQEYIRDVYIAIGQANAPTPEAAEANIYDKVYPRQLPQNSGPSEAALKCSWARF